MNWNDPKFVGLRNVWYKKLKASGFYDIEDSKERLEEWHSYKYLLKDRTAFSSQQRYYELAGQLLHSHKFKNIRDKSIWKFHCEGRSGSWIARKIGLHRSTVEKVIRELAELLKA